MYWMKTAASAGCAALVGNRKRLPPEVTAVPYGTSGAVGGWAIL